jgi:hypothetical protein
MDPSFLPPPPVVDVNKHSRLGVASFIISIISALIICFDVVLAFGISGGLNVSKSYAGVDTAFTCLAALLAILGLGLGIAGVAQKNAKKVFGILGLVFSALIFLGICALMGINLLSNAGSL